MFPTTPPVADTTRPRLRQIAYWIRDELDPVIAREGPDHLRADDVLILHDVFQALRTSNTITALDLRATGIHKAVMDVSGIATRWPGRLCDDCDKIISIWRAKFGHLEDLRPFLYGRGGRLEGIASVEESTKQALIKRWQKHCPEKISPSRSHRHGDLGFRAGDWWINPLFAWHAGIIDLDTVEGGICFDKHGAYAMLLKDTGEIEAPADSSFTYRCGRNDKGRFRLTAATAKSRNSIRVLRSHSINSIWGPKAGVRYEGLYNVVGWAVHQIKRVDISGDEHMAGDIVYDVRFERDDPVPMEEVVKVPTTFQVDEYGEYKRLRKLYREQERKGHISSKTETQLVSMKAAPPIPPLAQTISPPKPQPPISPAASRTTTFREPLPAMQTGQAQNLGLFDTGKEPFGAPASALSVPMRTLTHLSKSASPISESKSQPLTLPTQMSKSSSNQSHNSDIREVAPWIDAELELYAQTGSPMPPVAQDDASRVSYSTTRSIKVAHTNPNNSASPMHDRHSGEKLRKYVHYAPASGRVLKSKESRKSILKHSRNPMAKLFDGTKDGVPSGEDYFNFKRRAQSVISKESSPMVKQHTRANSSHEMPLSPTPLRPMSPDSPLLTERRGALCLSYSYSLSSSPGGFPGVEVGSSAHNKTSATHAIDDMSHWVSYLPVTLQGFISSVKPASTLTTPTSAPRLHSKSEHSETEGEVGAVEQLKRFIDTEEDKVRFKNPFDKQTAEDSVPMARRESSASIAPDDVV